MLALAGESVTVNTAAAAEEPVGSVTTVSVTTRPGGSSSWIVATPSASAIVTWTGLERRRKKVSFGSLKRSPRIGTAKVRCVVPGGKATASLTAT